MIEDLTAANVHATAKELWKWPKPALGEHDWLVIFASKEIERLNERITELQRCNNREVERRRVAEGTHLNQSNEPMRSAHEGYALIFDRVTVLWDEVRRRPDVARSRPAMRIAAQGVAAACGRFMHEVCDGT